MKLTDQQVRHVAKLARLALTLDEVTRYGAQLSAILDAVEVLGQVDVSAVSPPAQTQTPHLRDDEVQGELGAKVALSNAPQVSGTSFAIPKVLE